VAREFFDRQIEHWAYVRRSDIANEKLVIFVHGFRGSYLSTWGELANYLTEYADNDPKLARWDYLFVGYETYSIGTFMAIAGVIASHWERASTHQPPFDRNAYKELAIFAHSLGTLGVRQLLCAIAMQPEGMAQALNKAVLFGSPLNGSHLAGLGGLGRLADVAKGKPASLLPGSFRIVEALKVGNPELEMLHIWSKTMRAHGKSKFGPTRIITGTDDHVVGSGGLVDWEDDGKKTTAMDHRQMVKVANAGANTQGTVIDELRGLR
jgi:hypothetical protein